MLDRARMSAALDRIVARLDKPGRPGAAIAIVHRGDVLHRGAFGLASVELSVPLAPHHVFTVASVTKQFTCLAAWRLIGEGRLDADAPIAGLLDRSPCAEAGITVRHLMSNSSGLPDMMEMLILGGGDLGTPVGRARIMDLLKRQTLLNFAPGTNFLYSNSNFALLQEIVERIEDKSLGDILRDRILAPAGMAQAVLRTDPQTIVPGLVDGYLIRDGALLRSVDNWPSGGEAGLRASLDDLIAWARYCGRDDEAIVRMGRPDAFANGSPSFYGSGLQALPWRNVATVGHGGLMPGFLTEFCRVPELDLAIVVAANSDAFQPWLVAREILDGALGFGHDDAYLAADRIHPGAYIAEDGFAALELYAEGGRAYVRQNGAAMPLGADGAALRGVFPFGLDVAGATAETLAVRDAAGNVRRYRRLHGNGALPAGLDGVWTCEALGATYRIAGESVAVDGPFATGTQARAVALDGQSFRIESAQGWYKRDVVCRLGGDRFELHAARSRGFVFRRASC